jgi:hypothetical protein
LHGGWKRNAPEFSINEIRNATEEQTRGSDESGDIKEVEKRKSSGSRKEKHRNENADHSAMTRHATLMDGEDPPEGKVRREIDDQGGIVKQAISNPASNKNTPNTVGDEISGIGS